MLTIKDYVRVEPSEANGTSWHYETIVASPNELSGIFGVPDQGDDYKVAWKWVLKDKFGHVVTLYDWKQTSLYEIGMSNPEDLLDTELEFHIGGHTHAPTERLAEALKEELNGQKKA